MARKVKQEWDEEENGLTKNNICPSAIHKEHIAHLYKGVNVVHQSLGSANDELVHTGYGMGPARTTGTVNSTTEVL